MSTSNDKETSYHHGNLRNELIAAGVKMLGEEGEQGISMRKLARKAGVSHNAPYMHFADKEALLVAIAEEGFGILTRKLTAVLAGTDSDWHTRLRAISWAYVQFALAHRNHLNVMFRAYDPDKYPHYYQTTASALNILTELVEAGQTADLVIAEESKRVATLIWSLLHGVSLILAGGKMPPDVLGEQSPQALVEQFIEMLYGGINRNRES